MKIRFYLLTIILLEVLFFSYSCEDFKKRDKIANSAISNDIDSISYAIGADIGDNLIGQGVKINYNAFSMGFKNGYQEKSHLLSLDERRNLFKLMQDRMRSKQQVESR